jgi:hypothetical protein
VPRSGAKCGSAARSRSTNSRPAVAQQLVRILGIFGRYGEWRYRIDPLAFRPQRLAAGGEKAQRSAGSQHSLGQRGGSADHVLARVQYQHQPTAGERPRHALRRDFAAAKIEPDRRGNGDGHEAGIGDWRKLGQPHTVGKLRQKPVRHGESEPRLADAAGASQGDEPMRGGKAQDLAENVIPANQLGNRLR